MTDYEKRMEMRAIQSVKVINTRIADLEKQLKEAKNALSDTRTWCPHTHTIHHARRTAEDDTYDECTICGVIL